MDQNQKSQNQDPNWKAKKHKLDLDPSDLDALRKFFDDHSDYTTFELTHKYGIPASTTRYWKRVKLGIIEEPNALVNFKTRRKKKDYGEPLLPEIWDNGPWFKQKYEDEKIGAYVIAKMINRSVQTVYKKLKRFQIPLRSHKEAVATRNPCHNREWLWQAYIYEGKILAEMAKEANVNPYTILHWLVEFNITIRDTGTTIVIRTNKRKQKEYREKHGTSPKKT
jgi:hypothetical protein